MERTPAMKRVDAHMAASRGARGISADEQVQFWAASIRGLREEAAAWGESRPDHAKWLRELADFQEAYGNPSQAQPVNVHGHPRTVYW
jgi:hypothetical protein